MNHNSHRSDSQRGKLEGIDNFLVKDTIGQGTFGKVKLCSYPPTGENYAVKILNKKTIAEKNEMHLVKRELNIINKFNHENVIKVFNVIEDSKNYYILMEYCSRGELFDYIVAHQRLSEEEASMFFYELINGIEHIHSKGVVHRDLKPENLLLTSNKELKIIDFGLSSLFDGKRLLTTKCGSPSYAAPEIIRSQPYSGFKTDVWCCGIILYAMLCGYLPFEGEENKVIFKNILKGEIEYPEWLSSYAINLISKLLIQDPNYRIDIPEIKKTRIYEIGKDQYNIKHCHNKRTKSLINGNNYLGLKTGGDNIKSDSNILTSEILQKQNSKSKKIVFQENSLTQKLNELLRGNKRNTIQNKENKKNNIAIKPKKVNYINFINPTSTNSPVRVNPIDYKKVDSKRTNRPKIMINEFDMNDRKDKTTRVSNNFYNFNVKTTKNDNYPTANNNFNSLLNNARLLRFVSSGRSHSKNNTNNCNIARSNTNNSSRTNTIIGNSNFINANSLHPSSNHLMTTNYRSNTNTITPTNPLSAKYRANSLTTREITNHFAEYKTHKDIGFNLTSKLFTKDMIKMRKSTNIKKPGIGVHLKSQGNSLEKNNNNYFAERRKKYVPTLI